MTRFFDDPGIQGYTVTADTVTGEIISSWDMHGNPTCGDPPPSIRL